MIHLFWTGGWDSTFRLLQLLLIEKKVVQPHYLVTGQKSTGKEIDTIYKLIGKIYKEYPVTREFLKPITVKDAAGIEPNEEIMEVYHQIKKKQKINAQYELLARYCHQVNKKIEVCIEPYGDQLVLNYLNTGLIFDRYFHYPLAHINKRKMATISNENGWSDIMAQTWFCRVPYRGKPCGLCGPCTDILIAGMDSRLPFKPKLIARLQLPLRKFWRNNYEFQSKAPFKYIRKLFDGRV